MTDPYELQRFARQFVYGPQLVAPATFTEHAAFGPEILRAHCWAKLERVSEEHRELLVVGHLLDPDQPHLDNAAVVGGLFARAISFSAFEAATSPLAGRWLAFVRIGGEARVYPDAAGMRSAFYARMNDGRVVVASQPNLLADVYGLSRDADLDEEFARHRHFSNGWPCEVTPFPSVRQLLPNHYLNLSTGTAHRFWPKNRVASVSVDHAAQEIAKGLHGTIAAAVHRGSAALALTAGYDSRTLYAAAGELRPGLAIFRVNGQHLPRYDTSVPRRLTRRFGGHLEEIVPQRCPPQLLTVMRDNVARLWSDPGDYMLYSFASLKTDLVLLGQLSEIGRCFYYPDGAHPDRVDADLLARLTHYESHPIARKAFAQWLETAPAEENRTSILDLLYWEHRAGNWASLLATASDTFFDGVAPYNSRRLLETALGVDVTYRRSPYLLHRQICEVATAGSSSLPFNFSWPDAFEEWLLGRLPWRIQNLLRQRRAA